MATATSRVAGTIVGALVLFTTCAAPAQDGAAEQRWACQHDAFAYCSSEIPNVERITACMVKNLKKLSPLCRAQFRQPAGAHEPARSAHEVL